MQEKLDVIAMDIGRIGMYAALLIFHLLVARNLIEAIVFRKFSLFEKDDVCKKMMDAELLKESQAPKDKPYDAIVYICDG